MCGRTACTLAPDDVCSACSYRDKNGKQRKPIWRDPPGGQQYYPSYNVAPASYTPVVLSSRHYHEELGSLTERVIQPMRWGLVPSWHKGAVNDVGYETNNCRAEGMLQKRTYKVPLEKGRRCVVLADGFYEWKRSKDQKQPYFIYFPQSTFTGQQKMKQESQNIIKTEPKTEPADTLVKIEECKPNPDQNLHDTDVKVSIKTEVKSEQFENEPEMKPGKHEMNIASQIKSEPLETKTENGKPDSDFKREDDNNEENVIVSEWQGRRLLTMAGVFDIWNPPDGSGPVYSYSVVTVDASPAMDFIHHRMPAILTTEQEVEDWIDFGKVPLTKAAKLIRPVETIQLHPVSSEVNNSRNKSPNCIKPVDPQKPKLSGSSKLMMNWLVKPKREESVKSDEPPLKKLKS